jgi:predicted GH43/DUF377 family glycosyl hydrolase
MPPSSMLTSTLHLEPGVELTVGQRRLIGAAFTHEYAIEGAALCNPSMVLHPDQPGNGEVRFVLSVRGIGEGHRSSIGFRTGTIRSSGAVAVDPPGAHLEVGSVVAGTNRRSVFHGKLAELGDDRGNASFVLDALPPEFTEAQLEDRIAALLDGAATRRHTASTIAHLRQVAQSSYRVEFPAATTLSERVLWPHSANESHGMEDARFVRFGEHGGTDHSDAMYYATYTAFNGVDIAQHLLATDDFTSFEVSPLAGVAAVGKGLALFPRRVQGRYVALSRADHETNSIAFTEDLHCWDTWLPLQMPVHAWEILQLGNCGSPIETEAGWLVITHGVGPMRTYSLGAILLDLDEPQRVLAMSSGPILSPGADRQGGYVPNVVYSCGAMAHEDMLVLPYGVGDRSIAVATLSIDQLLGSLVPT